MAGRPPKYTPARVDLLLAALRTGSTRTAAAEACGIPRGTLHEWTVQYPAFLDAVQQAEAQAVGAMVGRVYEASKTTWQAAAWWLERRYPADWGRVERHALTGEGGGPLTLMVERVAGRLPDGAERLPDA